MDEREHASAERDPRFPSGDWTGFFLQYGFPGRNTTEMRLTWGNGTLTGAGRDLVGPFTVSGTYDTATGRCEWVKAYTGRHTVAYRGVNDGHGIWGVWEIRQLFGLYVDRGGFHIWPEGTNVSEASERTERAVTTAMRAEFGTGSVRPLIGLLLAMISAALGAAAWRILMP